MGILDRILRAGEGKKLKALEGLVPDVNARAAEMGALSDDALRAKTAEFRGRIERGGLRLRCSSARLGKPAAQQVRRPADKTTAVLQEQDQRFHAVPMGQCRIPS